MSNSQQNIQQILQKALSSWRDWQTGELVLKRQPEVHHELLGGKTNRSFLVASGSFKAVVRINAANSQSLGIDRNRELKILQLLQPTGTVPMLFFSDEQVMVSSYCQGQHWVDSAENRSNLNTALAKIQAIAVPDLAKRNYVDYCTAYINQLDQHLVDQPLVEKILSAASAVDKSDWTAVICHHDLVPENILITAEGLKLLDWEYAAMGHPTLDYIRLYKSDLRSTNLAYDRNIIEQLATVQDGMDDLWSLVQEVVQVPQQ